MVLLNYHAAQNKLPKIRGSLCHANGDAISQSNAQLFEEMGPRVAIFLNQCSISNIVGETGTGEALLVISETYQKLQLLNLNCVTGETFFNFSCYELSSWPETTIVLKWQGIRSPSVTVF